MDETIDMKAIKERISKLLAKAEGTTNEHEAAAFLAKVEELLERYQLDLYEVRGFDSDPLGNNIGETNVYQSIVWAKQVIHAVAKFYGATTVWEGRSGPKGNHLPYRLFGRESARVTTELMLPYILSQVKQQGRKYANDYGVTHSIGCREVGIALVYRINDMLKNVEAHRADLQSRALVPVSDLKALTNDYYGGNLRKGKRVKGASHSARSYAEKISINQQMGGKRALIAG